MRITIDGMVLSIEIIITPIVIAVFIYTIRKFIKLSTRDFLVLLFSFGSLSLFLSRLWYYLFYDTSPTILIFLKKFIDIKYGGLAVSGFVLGIYGAPHFFYFCRNMLATSLTSYWHPLIDSLPNRRQLLEALFKAFAFVIILDNLGCFLDGHTLGRMTDLPFGMHRTAIEPFSVARHPVDFYEIVGFIIIYLSLRKSKNFEFHFVILFCIIEFIVGFLIQEGTFLFQRRISIDQIFYLFLLIARIVIHFAKRLDS